MDSIVAVAAFLVILTVVSYWCEKYTPLVVLGGLLILVTLL